MKEIKLVQERKDNVIQYWLKAYQYGYEADRRLVATYQKNIKEGFYHNVTKQFEISEHEYNVKKHKTLMNLMFELAEKLGIETYDFKEYNR